MHIGCVFFNTGYAIPIDELAREMEARGFESLFVPEHTHIPVSRRSPFGGGTELPRQYLHTLDPFVGLTAAAMVTKKLKLGTGICLIIERDTITTAKSVASVDFVSGGRFLFGIGGGWNIEEMEHHGTDPKTRFKRLEEQVRACREIWTKEEPQYHGQYVNFDAIWSYPKPVQKPHPPVLLGGESVHTLQRVVDVCDGWFPRGRGGVEPIIAGMKELAVRAEKAGRDPKSISVNIFAAKPERESLDKLAAAGATRAAIMLPSASREEVLPLLDRYTAFIR